jgi:aryl-alcohol dehydrogenase-like predicted oxidoreductase
MERVASGAPMDEHPFPVPAHGDRDRFHRRTALGVAIAGPVVEVATPQTVGAMVAMSGAGCVIGDVESTLAAPEGSRRSTPGRVALVARQGNTSGKQSDEAVAREGSGNAAQAAAEPGKARDASTVVALVIDHLRGSRTGEQCAAFRPGDASDFLVQARAVHAAGMERRKIGSLDVSAVGIGCNNFGMRIDEAASKAVVDAALDAGVNMFDTADVYGGTKSEEFLGRALGSRRDEAVIATKFGAQIDEQRRGAKPAYVRTAVEDSLRRLGTDRIDLYQLHVPDADTPIEETLGALDALVQAGKVREIGASNFTPEMIDTSEGISASHHWARFASVQNEYSLLRRLPERGVLDACVRNGIGFLPYFPLASGMLTSKYRRNEPPPAGTRLASMPQERRDQAFSEKNFNRVEAMEAWAHDHGHTVLELAIAWLLARPAVASVIAGATKPDQVRANVAGAGWELTEADLAEIDTLLDEARA